MVRNVMSYLGLAAVFVVAVIAVSLVIGLQNARSAPGLTPELSDPQAPVEQIGTTGQYVWSFAAKFVCGIQLPFKEGQQPLGEPVFKPGNYATDINIHNYNYREVPIRKKLIFLVSTNADGVEEVVREPKTAQPIAYAKVTLGPDGATLDDCNALYIMAYGADPTAQLDIMSGYLVILSPVDLDVDVVYTAAEPTNLFTTPISIAIDVNRVTGKRVYLPAGALP